MEGDSAAILVELAPVIEAAYTSSPTRGDAAAAFAAQRE